MSSLRHDTMALGQVLRDRRGASGDGGRAALAVAAGYALLAAFSAILAALFRDGPPWAHPDPWLPVRPAVGATASLALGLGVTVAVIPLTRFAVERYSWARRLHDDLAPVAKRLGTGHILLLAGLSSLGEELLFRGLLTPWLGVFVSSLIFGFAHQMRGPSRWVWVVWATVMGLCFAAIFALTGSLVGPLVAHALINAVNLAYLRGKGEAG